MTTTTSNPQTQYGTGAPVALAPNGTRYFDTSVNPIAEYVCISGVWYSIAAGVGAVAQVVLTSAQVLALFTTKIQLIPAPGTGKLIIVENVTYKGTGAYTQADGAGLVYHGTAIGADNSYTIAADPFINGTTYSSGISASQVNVAVTTCLGLAVDVASITTNPTVGTTPVTVTATYKVITP